MKTEKLVLDIKPAQLVLSKDGTLKVGFFDRVCEVDVKTDDKGRKISSREINKLYIHIEIPADPTTVVERVAGERKIIDGEDVRWIAETTLFERAYAKYLELKNGVVYDPQAEIEELKRKLAASEIEKTQAENLVKSQAEKFEAEKISAEKAAEKEAKKAAEMAEKEAKAAAKKAGN